jgi:hypothetical protein
MADTLASLCQGDLDNLAHHDPWKNVISAFLKDKQTDQNTIDLLVSQCAISKAKTPHQYISFLRKVLTIIITTKSTESLKKAPQYQSVLLKLFENNIYDKLHLVLALKNLIFLLIDLPQNYKISNQLESGIIFQSDSSYWQWAKLPDLKLNSELGIIWSILANKLKSNAFANASYKLANWKSNVLDHNSYPYLLWSQENGYNEMSLLCSLYLLFFSTGRIFNYDNFQDIAQNILKHITSIKNDVISPYYIALTKYISDEVKNQTFEKPQIEKSTFSNFTDTTCNFFSNKTSVLNAAFTTNGFNSSIGAIHSQDIKISAMGPQFSPLENSSRFGILKKPSLSEHVKMDGSSIRGWTQICNSFENVENELAYNFTQSATWMEFFAHINENQCDIELQFSPSKRSENIYFSLYINTPIVFLDQNNQIVNGSLDRYYGKSKKIALKSKKETIILLPENFNAMHIIPLAGKNTFWNCNFLIAYEIFKQTTNLFKLSIEKI